MTADTRRPLHALRGRILLLAASGPWTVNGIHQRSGCSGGKMVTTTINRFRESGLAGLHQLPDGAFRRIAPYLLKAGDAARLRRLQKDRTTPLSIARRARAVLAAHAGALDTAIAAAEGVPSGIVRNWLERYRKGGIPLLCRVRVYRRQRGPGIPIFRLKTAELRALRQMIDSGRSLAARRARAVVAAASNPAGVKAVADAAGLGYSSAVRAVQLFLASGIAGLIPANAGEKTDKAARSLEKLRGEFSYHDLMRSCPGISSATIRSLMRRELKQGRLIRLAQNRYVVIDPRK
jgi:transposase